MAFQTDGSGAGAGHEGLCSSKCTSCFIPDKDFQSVKIGRMGPRPRSPLNLPPYATDLDRPAIFWIRSDRSTDPITSYSTSVTRGISEMQQLIQLILNTKLAPRRNVEIYPTSFVSNDCENNFSNQMR